MSKGNGTSEQKEPFTLAPARRTFFEQFHNVHRILVPVGTTRDQLEAREFLSACGDKVSGGDVCHVFSEDWRQYWQCLAVGAGVARHAIDGGDVQLVVLIDHIKLPAVATANADVPRGYAVKFSPANRRYFAYFGETVLGDGVPQRDEALRIVKHHQRQAASVSRSVQ